MEVRPGQHSVTIAQACAHNVSTVDRDMDMFRKLLVARGDTMGVARLDTAQHYTRIAYESLLAMYGDELADFVQSGHDHPHEITGNERVHAPSADADMIDNAALVARGIDVGKAEITQIAIDVAHRAAKFETR